MLHLEADFLHKLPASVTGELLGSWLSVKDTVKLDSAHCNHQLRLSWLGLLQADVCIVHEQKLKENVLSWNWLYNRGLKISCATFSNPFTGRKEVERYFKKFGSFMKSVRVDNVPPVVMELIASHCTHLTYFECRNISSGDNFGFRNILLRNPHLEELMLVGLPQAELDGVSLPKLHSIELHNCAFVNDQSVLSLVKLSSKITRLCLNGGESVSRATLTKLAAQLPLLMET